jgi:hypothetical protein
MKDSVSGSETASSHHFEYVALRIMDLEVAQDRASVTAIAATAVPLLVRLPRGQRCATDDSRQVSVHMYIYMIITHCNTTCSYVL